MGNVNTTETGRQGGGIWESMCMAILGQNIEVGNLGLERSAASLLGSRE